MTSTQKTVKLRVSAQLTDDGRVKFFLDGKEAVLPKSEKIFEEVRRQLNKGDGKHLDVEADFRYIYFGKLWTMTPTHWVPTIRQMKA